MNTFLFSILVACSLNMQCFEMSNLLVVLFLKRISLTRLAIVNNLVEYLSMWICLVCVFLFLYRGRKIFLRIVKPGLWTWYARLRCLIPTKNLFCLQPFIPLVNHWKALHYFARREFFLQVEQDIPDSMLMTFSY